MSNINFIRAVKRLSSHSETFDYVEYFSKEADGFCYRSDNNGPINIPNDDAFCQKLYQFYKMANTMWERIAVKHILCHLFPKVSDTVYYNRLWQGKQIFDFNHIKAANIEKNRQLNSIFWE